MITLAIDAGQTSTKVRIRGLGESPTEAAFPGVVTDRPVLPQIAAIIHETTARARRVPAVIAVGASGLLHEEGHAAWLRSELGAVAAGRILVAHDSITSFLGALGLRDGAVVAAGTGVVTLAVGPLGVARVDGWGNIMGDAGSSYWFGRRALDDVMRAYDGRGPATALTEVVCARWPNLAEAYMTLQADPDRVRIIADFARAVSELSGRDEVAHRIVVDGAAELVASAAAALEKAGCSGDTAGARSVVPIGGLFQSQPVADEFTSLMTARHPGVNIEAEVGEGIDGAELLAGLSDTHPLAVLTSSLAPDPLLEQIAGPRFE
ncbi:BadF/BadG/BcrA/BcrD ATPase family protein [Microbacterium sp. PRC9]|uniref:N-acetylglucosamine kinase n=1 Tax=Microbacterium sp. PRC9 TaxID=2962591 RepID=UPI0028820D2E|nr:BadF/BadG/BcrA/BcrD ATPase family protein [Microbacterium sp. PRC9]MDT0144511.1 BadF/BadG/BcrA/BcrD ATPase family protein [Microbacterium sp. PRC9]